MACKQGAVQQRAVVATLWHGHHEMTEVATSRDILVAVCTGALTVSLREVSYALLFVHWESHASPC